MYKPGDQLKLRYRIGKMLSNISNITMPTYTLRSCEDCHEATHSFGPGKPILRPDQARVLTQIMLQEDPKAFGAYAEEAIEEACLEDYEIHILVCLLKYGEFLGGVLAQEVGFGKTAIILALIDATRVQTFVPKDIYGKISTRATLIIVPSTIVRQWKGQVDFFLGEGNYNVVMIPDAASLARLTVRDIQKADIVIVNVDIFHTIPYLTGVSVLAGLPVQNNTNTRPFKAWYDWASRGMDQHVQRMKTHGLRGMADRLVAAFVKANADVTLAQNVATTRFQGQAYVKDVLRKAQIEDVDDEVLAEIKAEAEAAANAKAAREAVENFIRRFQMNDSKTLSDMRFPILQIFLFPRIVVDEYTYVSDIGHILIAAIMASKRWVLSGTPKLGDFMDVKKLASLLNFNLGEDDDTPGIIKHYNIKKLRSQQTGMCHDERTGLY